MSRRSSDLDREEVLRLQAEGCTQKAAAKQLMCCTTTLSEWSYRNGVRWVGLRGCGGTPRSSSRVNDLLFEMGISHAEAGGDIGTHGPAVTNLASGQQKYILLADGVTFSGPAQRLADYLGMPPEWLWADLQEDFGSHPDITPKGLLLDAESDHEPADNALVHAEMLFLLRGLLDQVCNERQRFVLTRRYGLDDGEARTLAEVGKEINRCRESVRQIESKALLQLRSAMEAL